MDRVFAAGGEVGRLMAGMDWSTTPLGPVRSWRAELRMAVSICLESKFPMEVMWGSDLVELHNDALIPLIGDKHPGCLGLPFRKIYPEVLDEVRPMLDQVMSGNGATWAQDWYALMDRHGFLEECYFTFSYSPIRQIPDGEVAGVLVAAQETTRQVLGTRRLSCLRELASVTSGRHTPAEVFTHAVEVLSRCSADVPYSMILLRDLDAPQPALRPAAASGLTEVPKVLGRLGTLDPDGLLPELGDALTSGRMRIADRMAERLVLKATAGSPPSSSAIAVPLTEGGDTPPIGLLLAGISDQLPADGDYRTFLSVAASQITAAAAVARVAEVKLAMAAEARHRAMHDGLTGLPNRAALFEQLQRTLVRSRQRKGRVGFLFVDLDGFKNVNDTLGHQAGDDLLREVAHQLRQAVRPGDMVARLSGDEFAVLCQDVTSTKTVETVADRIIATLGKPRAGAARTITVTASVGIALTGPDVYEPDELVRAADVAMYAAKRQGRDRRLVFDESMLDQS